MALRQPTATVFNKPPIGSGETAEVYLVRDRELDRDVAFKVLKNRYTNDEQSIESFKREARKAASLACSNNVAVCERGRRRMRPTT